jgi:uncharacterized membrane protein
VPEHELTQRVEAPPEALFAWLSDVRNLPRYMHRMTDAEPRDGEAVLVHATLPGGERVAGEAWFRRHPDERRIEWGSEGPADYHGWLQVLDDGDASRVEVHLSTERADGSGVDQGMAATLGHLRDLAASGAIPS